MKHKVKHIHFVGIGGAGMSGIAEIMSNLGYHISGSDIAESPTTVRLQSLGIQILIGHQADNIRGADAVVTSTAIASDNPEVLFAQQRHIPIVPRAQMLAELMRLKQGIAIAGTHGKTTTTSLVASILAEANLDPTFVIGGKLNHAGVNAKLGQGEFIVVEADESDASFLYLQPILSVVTNIDADHMSTYGHDFSRLRQAFVDFLQHLPFYGVAVLCEDDAAVREIMPAITKQIITYGINTHSHIQAHHVTPQHGRMHFDVIRQGFGDTLQPLSVELNLPGEHNVRNALAAIAVATELGIQDDAILNALSQFRGVGRRFQRYGEMTLPSGGSFTLIDDYGHHPVEIAATLAAARGAFPGRRIVLAFQPHRYSRTRDLFEDFVHVLSTTDALILTDVYPAGETPLIAADGRTLARALRIAGKVEPLFIEQTDALPEAILNFAHNNDVIITMGAGSIGQIPQKICSLVDPEGKLSS